jgi:hypothetical protein
MDQSLIARPINLWRPHSRRPLRTTFSWSPAQPPAVAVYFHPPHSVRWDLDRLILFDGLFERAGGGDVTVTPDPVIHRRLSLTLSSPDGRLCVFMPRFDVTAFLLETNYVIRIDADLPPVDDLELELFTGFGP